VKSKAAETNARMLASLIIGVGEIASVVRETLERDQLTPDDRTRLQATLATSIQGISTVLELARPGTGEALTQAFLGYPGRDTASEV
jgi:hypothetical protein